MGNFPLLLSENPQPLWGIAERILLGAPTLAFLILYKQQLTRIPHFRSDFWLTATGMQSSVVELLN
jgi:hypothetical protein